MVAYKLLGKMGCTTLRIARIKVESRLYLALAEPSRITKVLTICSVSVVYYHC